MSVLYILTQAGNKMGLQPSNAQQRAVLLRFLNEAAVELYVQADMANSLVEQVFKVNGDQTISLPNDVGQLRAVREYNSHIPWHINQMRPRYNQSNWKDMWRNWRIKGEQALMKAITNESLLTISAHAVESPAAVVTITGPTLHSAQISERVILDVTSKNTVNAFINDIVAVKRSTVGQYDITVSDVDNNVLTVVQNNVLEAKYLVVDISGLPWSTQSTSQQDHYVEILYKKALPWLSNDGDEFPARGYDNVIVNKMLQLWCEEQGKVDLAASYDAKATRSLARINEEQNRATQDEVALVVNPHDELLGRLRSNRPGRYPSIYPLGIWG